MAGEINSLIQSLDIFKRQPTFTIGGKDRYRTFCGGCTSVLIFILLGIYAFILIDQQLEVSMTSTTVANQTQTAPASTSNTGSSEVTFTEEVRYTQSKRKIENYLYPTAHYPGDHNFMLAAELTSDIDVDGLYIEFYLVNSTIYDLNFQLVPSTRCTVDMFPEELHDEFNVRLLGDLAICPNLTGVGIKSNFYSLDHLNLEVNVVK